MNSERVRTLLQRLLGTGTPLQVKPWVLITLGVISVVRPAVLEARCFGRTVVLIVLAVVFVLTTTVLVLAVRVPLPELPVHELPLPLPLVT